jgi:hypothetical protein
LDDDDFRHMAFSDVWYIALIDVETDGRRVGPLLRVRHQGGDEESSAVPPRSRIAADEPPDRGPL